MKEYKFVPEKGTVVTTSDLNLRKGRPATKGIAIAKETSSGTILEYIGYITDGEDVAGITKWYLTPEGNFFWSGNVDTKKVPVSLVTTEKCLHKPLNKLICTQRFGMRPDFYKPLGSPKGHNGIDFRTKKQDGTWEQPVYSVMDGKIFEAKESKWNGKYIRVNHDNGYQSVYLHLSKINVKKGDTVKGGSQIGMSGNSGSASEAPHLHFGYRPIKFDKDNGHMGYIDPTPYFIDEIQYIT